MRGESVNDYAVKWERAEALEKKLHAEGYKSLPSSRTKDSHWPSEITDCPRKKYYNFKGVQVTNPTTFKSESIFAFGSLVDDLTSKLFIRSRVFVEEEYPYRIEVKGLKYPLSGRIDVVIEEPDGTLIPVEVKTIKTDKFYDEERKWGPNQGYTIPGAITEPKLANVAQLMTYVYHMGTQYGYLVYWNKDNQDLCIHKVYWSQELFDDIVKACKDIEQYLELDTVPPRPNNFEIQFYQKQTDTHKRGDLKVNEVRFPCGWVDRETGEEVLCKWFDHCWAKEILDAPGANQELKDRINRHFEAAKAKKEQWEAKQTVSN